MSRSRIRNEIPPWPPSWVVCTAQTRKSARTPLVMKVFDAVDDAAAVDALGDGPDRGDVGAGARLGDPERADPLAGDRGAKEALVLSSVPKFQTGGVAIPV